MSQKHSGSSDGAFLMHLFSSIDPGYIVVNGTCVFAITTTATYSSTTTTTQSASTLTSEFIGKD